MLWVQKCSWYFSFLSNVLPQALQVCSFSLIWIRLWRVKCAFNLNEVLQTEHVKGFSPVWISKCLFKWEGAVQILPQNPQV